MSDEIVLIGIGQSLRGDDAAGLQAVKVWASKHKKTSRRIRIELVENPGISLLDLMIGVKTAILVDAVKSTKPPGFVHRVREDQVQAFSSQAQSAHGWGIAETLGMGRQLYAHSMPEKIIILGIEIESLEMGKGLSCSVKKALPELIIAIDDEIHSLFQNAQTPYVIPQDE